MRTRRQFSLGYKVEAVRLVLERGVSVARAARDLGVHVKSLRQWIQGARAGQASHAFPAEGRQEPDDAEWARVRRKVTQLRMERDILTKNAA
jgi:transposase